MVFAVVEAGVQRVVEGVVVVDSGRQEKCGDDAVQVVAVVEFAVEGICDKGALHACAGPKLNLCPTTS